MGELKTETRRLYYENPHMKEFEARVLEIKDKEVVLDKTCFYPEGGGQAGDTGVISGIRVTNTIKTDSELIKIGDQEIPVGGKIIHVLESKPGFSAGETVKASIDWDRRYRIMKLHSASHIMEHYLFQVFGSMDRIGSSVDDKKDRSEYVSQERLDAEKLAKVQQLCNEFISKNLDIKTGPSEENENVRVWQCADIKFFCGGTSVQNTKEIGKIRLKRENKGAGKERVETYLA